MKKSGASTNNMRIIGCSNKIITDEEEARGVALQSSEGVAKGVTQVSVGAKTSM